jgi:DNA polymerase III subunit epsilon
MFAIIDVETTGGAAQYERITEIAIVLHDGNAVVDQYSTLLNPERSIPWNITQLTGITDEMVAKAPKFYEVAKKIVEMTTDCVFVAHNVSFDYSFLEEEFKRLGYVFSRKKMCTVRMARKTFPGLPSYSLSNLKKHFGIRADKSHRALDDTLATVEVFERILEAQNGSSLHKFIQHGVKEAKLPQSISAERMAEVPEDCGVYYMLDAAQTVVYVGKSINIRKRLYEHFSDFTAKGEKLRQNVANIDWTVTGSELVALLLESREIKRLQPRVNRAQRIKAFPACIFSYVNQQGYHCLSIGKNTAKNAKLFNVLSTYPKAESAKTHLQALVRQHELCYRLSHLDSSERACFHYSIKKCKGACIGAEDPTSYNERVQAALGQLDRKLQGTFFIIDKGRETEEFAVVAVQDGLFLGFGYTVAPWSQPDPDELLACIDRTDIIDPDAPRIIHAWEEGKKGTKLLRFPAGS